MRRLLPYLLPLLAMLVAGSASAHGGGALVAGPLATGSYLVSVWVNSPTPRAAADLHFTVGVAEPANRIPVLDARVEVQLRRADGSAETISALATTEQSVNKLFYETDLQVPAPGLYEVTVLVDGSQGPGAVNFALEVLAPSRINWLLVGLAGLLLIGAYSWWRARRKAPGASG